MFIGREKELRNLNRLYISNKFEFAVIYGRRRVGKTALINEFTKGKPSICFTGVETNEKQNLENFSKCILEYVKLTILQEGGSVSIQCNFVTPVCLLKHECP